MTTPQVASATAAPPTEEKVPTVAVPRPDVIPIAPRRATPSGSRDAGCVDDPHAHDCKGQNDCKGLGGCKSDTNDCKGKNECKGKGGCKMASTRSIGAHACAGKNECKGLGGCKNDRSGCRGRNDCKGLGGCRTEAPPGCE